MQYGNNILQQHIEKIPLYIYFMIVQNDCYIRFFLKILTLFIIYLERRSWWPLWNGHSTVDIICSHSFQLSAFSNLAMLSLAWLRNSLRFILKMAVC